LHEHLVERGLRLRKREKEKHNPLEILCNILIILMATKLSKVVILNLP